MRKINSLEDLLRMNLHENIEYQNVIILRVHGGWIYTTKSNGLISSVFVSEVKNAINSNND